MWEGGGELVPGDGPVDERVEPGSRDGSADSSVGVIVEPESWDGPAERVGTDSDDGTVDVIVEPGSRDGSLCLMNLSSCGSMARSSIGPSGISMTITMSFVYAASIG